MYVYISCRISKNKIQLTTCEKKNKALYFKISKLNIIQIVNNMFNLL